MTKALIGAGCFWSVEEYFSKINGIQNTKVGYSGGHIDKPTYEEVCSGKTGHAEVVWVEYNQKEIDYIDIINHFWKCHDPTQLNKQGFDIGTQYRSVIYYYDDEQKKIAERSKKELQQKIHLRIVTKIEKAREFYLAEEYHQCYIKKRA